MATEAELYAEARKNMVDSQVRPNRVTDPRILSAMRNLPREQFLPPQTQCLAYTDKDIPLGNGRFMMEPMVLARMLQSARLQNHERVLIVAAGTGYSAAVLDACGCRVTALEDDPSLLAIANPALSSISPYVKLVSGPPAKGWPEQAPYDLILIDGAVPEIPAALAGQIHQETGRILAAIYAEGRITQAVQAEATGAGLGMTTMFDCATPPIPAMRKAPIFAF